jgi:predicted membrane protein
MTNIIPNLLKNMISKKLLLLLTATMLPLQVLLAQSKFEFKETAPLNGARKAKVVLDMPAGVLHVKAESNALAEANIKYDRADWKPLLTRSNQNQVTELRIKQPELKNSRNNETKENTWNINLSKNTPLELQVEFGAGESKVDLRNSKVEKLTISGGAGSLNLDLRGSQVKALEINTGVGEVVLDLRGNWNHDLQVEISSGLGEVKLLLPKSTGVRLKRSGMGSLSAGGLRKEKNYYRNQALGKNKHTLSINVSGGLGSVTVSQE